MANVGSEDIVAPPLLDTTQGANVGSENVGSEHVLAPPVLNTTQGTNVEVDESDHDSAISDSGNASELTSVVSGVFDYVYENGRRYHSNWFRKGKYFMPNDDGEQDRLDMYHHVFLTILGGRLYLAPLDQPSNILDIGTGTGIWAIDMAEQHPEATVIGTDISPIQPSWVPSNCRFEVDDAEEDWTYEPNYFDYIHIRALSGSFQDWDSVIGQSFKHIRPGGWIELQDYGCEVFYHTGELCHGTEDPMARYFDYLAMATDKTKRPLQVARTFKDRLTRAGFINVQEHTAIWPMGDWPKDKGLKELGRWGKLCAIESAEPFALHLLCGVLGWTEENAKALCADVKKSVLKGKYYCQAWFVYGQKPLEE